MIPILGEHSGLHSGGRSELIKYILKNLVLSTLVTDLILNMLVTDLMFILATELVIYIHLTNFM